MSRTVRTILLLVVPLLVAMPVSAQTRFPADTVFFEDDEHLQTKLDEGDLSGAPPPEATVVELPVCDADAVGTTREVTDEDDGVMPLAGGGSTHVYVACGWSSGGYGWIIVGSGSGDSIESEAELETAIGTGVVTDADSGAAGTAKISDGAGQGYSDVDVATQAEQDALDLTQDDLTDNSVQDLSDVASPVCQDDGTADGVSCPPDDTGASSESELEADIGTGVTTDADSGAAGTAKVSDGASQGYSDTDVATQSEVDALDLTQDDVTDDDVESMGTSGAVGTVPQSDGAGSLSMQDNADQAELDAHEGTSDAHHAQTTDTGPVADCTGTQEQDASGACFDGATQAEQDAHAATSDAHHTQPDASTLTGTDAGTDLTADLEEEGHGAEHAEGAADPVLSADPATDHSGFGTAVESAEVDPDFTAVRGDRPLDCDDDATTEVGPCDTAEGATLTEVTSANVIGLLGGEGRVCVDSIDDPTYIGVAFDADCDLDDGGGARTTVGSSPGGTVPEVGTGDGYYFLDADSSGTYNPFDSEDELYRDSGTTGEYDAPKWLPRAHKESHEEGGGDAINAFALVAPNASEGQVPRVNATGGLDASTIGEIYTGSGLPYGSQACSSLQDVFSSEQGLFQCVGTGDAASAVWQPVSPIYLIGPRRYHRNSTTGGSTDCLVLTNFVLDGVDSCTATAQNITVPVDGVVRRITVTVQGTMNGSEGVDYVVYEGGAEIARLEIPPSDEVASVGTTYSETIGYELASGESVRIAAEDGTFCENGTGCEVSNGHHALIDLTFHPQSAP